MNIFSDPVVIWIAIIGSFVGNAVLHVLSASMYDSLRQQIRR